MNAFCVTKKTFFFIDKEFLSFISRDLFHIILSFLQNHTPNHITTNQQNAIDHSNGLYRATTYHNSHDYIYGQNAGSSTGAVPRNQQWHGSQNRSEEINKPQGQNQRQYQDDNSSSNNQVVSVTIENQKEQQKDGKNSKSMTKTYHTIKDMISSRFKGKDEMNGDKNEEAGLNNVTEELRKSIRSVDKVRIFIYPYYKHISVGPKGAQSII